MTPTRRWRRLGGAIPLALGLALAACSSDDDGHQDPTYTIGGTIGGLTGSGLILSSVGQADLAIATAQTTFTFATAVGSGTAYDVRVRTQPAGQVCFVAHPSGTVGAADVTDVAVTCQASAAFTATDALAEARAWPVAVALPSGKVLVAGGQVYATSDWKVTATAELYDPATGQWSAASPMGTARSQPCALVLPSGQVLVAGGYHHVDGTLLTAELYDPASDTWAPTAGAMAAGHEGPGCATLADGRLLLAGGMAGGTEVASAVTEIFDPATGRFTVTGPLATARYFHTATPLADGTVLAVGGCVGGWPCLTATASAERFDPATGLWTATGPLPATRVAHSATRLQSGRLLVAGGCLTYHGTGHCGDDTSDRAAAVFDPALGTWTPTGSLLNGHAEHAAALLPSGDVLLVSGTYFSGSERMAERYDPALGLWAIGPAPTAEHGNGVAAAPLAGGRWLFLGGTYPAGTMQLYSAAAEIFEE